MRLIHIKLFCLIISLPYVTLCQNINWEYSISGNTTGFLRNTKLNEKYRLIEGDGFGQELSYKFKLNKPNSLFFLTGLTFDLRSFYIGRDSLSLNQYTNSTIGIPIRLNLYNKNYNWMFFSGFNIGYNIKGKVTDLNFQNKVIDYGFNQGKINPIQFIAEFGIQYNLEVISLFIKRSYGLNNTYSKDLLFKMKTNSLGIVFNISR